MVHPECAWDGTEMIPGNTFAMWSVWESNVAREENVRNMWYVFNLSLVGTFQPYHPCAFVMGLVLIRWVHSSHMSGNNVDGIGLWCYGYMSKYVSSLQSRYILNVSANCNLDVMQGYTAGKFEMGLKCKDQLLVRDNLGEIGRYIWNVISLGLVVTCGEYVQGTPQICLICVWWLHFREIDSLPSMFLTCSYLFLEALAPSATSLHSTLPLLHFAWCAPEPQDGVRTHTVR